MSWLSADDSLWQLRDTTTILFSTGASYLWSTSIIWKSTMKMVKNEFHLILKSSNVRSRPGKKVKEVVGVPLLEQPHQPRALNRFVDNGPAMKERPCLAASIHLSRDPLYLHKWRDRYIWSRLWFDGRLCDVESMNAYCRALIKVSLLIFKIIQAKSRDTSYTRANGMLLCAGFQQYSMVES